MRTPPGPIPARLPNVGRVAGHLQDLLERPHPRLNGVTPASLVHDFTDGTPAWLTGSTVWLPAVYGIRHRAGDLDIVVKTAEAAARLIVGSLAVLNVGTDPLRGPYRLARQRLGAARIVHPDGSHVMDVWNLGRHSSIEEMLLAAYPPGDHLKCAFLISRSPSAGCLFRLVGSAKAAALVRSVDSLLDGLIAGPPTKKPPGLYPGDDDGNDLPPVVSPWAEYEAPPPPISMERPLREDPSLVPCSAPLGLAPPVL